MIDLQKAVNDRLTLYVKEVDEALQETLPKVGKETVKQLKQTSPKLTGEYSKGWKQKVEKNGINGNKLTVYNQKYQLTHLLENGHAKVGGGFVSGIPHIKPAADKAEKTVIEEITKAIESYG
jgi:hypothetical protein